VCPQLERGGLATPEREWIHIAGGGQKVSSRHHDIGSDALWVSETGLRSRDRTSQTRKKRTSSIYLLSSSRLNPVDLVEIPAAQIAPRLRRARAFAVAMRNFRKHRALWTAAALYLLIFFFPALFLSRVLSPMDVFYNYDPWRTLRAVESQNSLMNDPGTSYITLISLLKDDAASLHWNRWIASGVPGYGSAAAAVLSPFLLLPGLLLPLQWVLSGAVLLKFLVALAGMYIFLREMKFGKRSAAIGAVTTAGSGIYAVWFLWQGTNATSLYPFLLLAVARIVHGKRNSILSLTLLAIFFAVSGFPGTVIYGGYLALSFLLFECMRRKYFPLRQILLGVIATVLAGMITLPALAPFAYLVKASGYLEAREGAAFLGGYPVEALRGFVAPLAWGDPLEHRWVGDAGLGGANNFIDSTLYLGIVPLFLAPLALLKGRRGRMFWVAATALLLLILFGVQPFARIAAALPGVGYSQLVRLRMLLPPLAGVLAAGGWLTIERILRRRTSLRVSNVATIVAVSIAFDLALFGARFHPYLPPDVATLPSSPTIEYLHSVKGPFRIAPMFDYLWPNSTELVRLEDVRSHFSSEAKYRRILDRFAPGSFGSNGTVIQFNALQFDVADPLVSMLNVRFLIEQPSIDILRWRLLEATTPSSIRTGDILLTAGMTRTVTFAIPDDRTFAVELPAEIRTAGTKARGRIRRTSSGEVLSERNYDESVASLIPRMYLPVWNRAVQGEALSFEIEIEKGALSVPASVTGAPLLGWVRTPLIPHSVRIDGKLFENVAALPRYWPVWETRRLSIDDMLADRSIDFRKTAVITGSASTSIGSAIGSAVGSMPVEQRASIQMLTYDGATTELKVDARSAVFVATSEKITPDLRVTVDGLQVLPVEINGMFAGIPMEAGTHHVKLTRRIGRDYWLLSLSGLALLIAASIFARRGRTTRMI